MYEKLSIDMLTQDSVSVQKQKYVEVEGVEYPIGEPWRRAYVNSPSGRAAVHDEVPDPQLTAIMAVWGEHPTVPDPEPADQPQEEEEPEEDEGEDGPAE